MTKFLQYLSLLGLATVVLSLPIEEVRSRERRQAENYVTYLPGTGLPLVLSAPHGGDLEPTSIPTRDAGCWDGNACIWSHTCGVKDPSRCGAATSKDLYTYELTMELRAKLFELTGQYPAVILNELHRRKLDANRDKPEATFGVPDAEAAWDLYNAYIDQAKADIGGMGLFFDLHGHGHTLQYAELGYLISAANLNSGNFQPEDTSIANLASYVGGSFEDLLRGTKSYGDFLQTNGYNSVPGPVHQSPGSNPYFSGGYLTRRHGSVDGGEIDAIQIESARSHREMPERTNYVAALADAMLSFLEAHYP